MTLQYWHAGPKAPALPVTLPPSAQELFLDNTYIASMTGLNRQLVMPHKHESNPRFVMGPGDRYIACNTQIMGPNGPELHYQAVNFADDLLMRRTTGDGVSWNGIGTQTMQDVHGPGILYEPDDLAKPYKMVGGASRGWSTDGDNWTIVPWPEGEDNDTCSSLIYFNGKYRAYVRDQRLWTPPGATPANYRLVGYVEAEDFDGPWSTKKVIFETDATDGAPMTQVYQWTAQVYGNQIVAIVRFLELEDIYPVDNQLGSTYSELMVSRDGEHFTRVANRAHFLDPTPGTWDEGIVVPATSFYEHDGRIWLSYVGAEYGHGAPQQPGEATRLGLATLPAGRFQSITGEGSLTTKSIETTGTDLVLNMDGAIGASLLADDYSPLAGFAATDMTVTRIDDRSSRISWAGGNLAAAMAGGPRRIRYDLAETDHLFGMMAA